MTHARLRVYLVELAKATLEAASDPVRLLPLLIRILLKAPLELVLMAQGSPWPSREDCPRCGAPQARRAA
jgi:hypothetical protein